MRRQIRRVQYALRIAPFLACVLSLNCRCHCKSRRWQRPKEVLIPCAGMSPPSPIRGEGAVSVIGGVCKIMPARGIARQFELHWVVILIVRFEFGDSLQGFSFFVICCEFDAARCAYEDASRL